MESQSLVNEGRFPHALCSSCKSDWMKGRNPSLMRAGFHFMKKESCFNVECFFVAIPR